MTVPNVYKIHAIWLYDVSAVGAYHYLNVLWVHDILLVFDTYIR